MKILKFEDYKKNNESLFEKSDVKSFFNDLFYAELEKLFPNRINSLNVSLFKNNLSIDFTIMCSTNIEENEHEISNNEDELNINAGYTLKVLKSSADVIEKSAKHFHKNPNNSSDMESSWNEGNFGMGISLTIFFDLIEVIKSYKEKIPAEIMSHAGINKFNL